ncbi:Inner membrane protein YedI [bioreactor metagenome]|uniref:Inner membrane protein YedI n=1 Tax=bioreactor metagenome TaxID=1076179 RepID=A0A644W0N5_9ZZZZ
MSGLLALLDDVAGIAKIAAASVDDVAGQAAKAGAKAAGAVIDDAAVTPKYVHGFAAARELPIVGKIALGSIRNKLVFLLPLALLLSAFAPWAITPLLMLGGSYLCFEGAEKVLHLFRPAAAHGAAEETGDPAHLEAAKVSGAVKTDFILSAEIMTIALAALPAGQPVWMEALALAVVALGITAAVYGGVALIVKMDDIGLWLARNARLAPTRAFGRGLVHVMPGFLSGLMAVGTAAMVWVGGSIVLHGAAETLWAAPYEAIHHLALTAAEGVGASLAGPVEWFVTAACDGVFGLAFGLALVPLVTKVINPVIARLSGKGGAH